MSSMWILETPPPPADARIAYGGLAHQHGELRLPAGAGPHPVVVVIHGGFWRAKYDQEHVGHLCADLTARGFATWSLEYRRVGHDGGGWPGTLEDVALGTDFLRTLARTHPLDLSRVVALGHSAGGHLAAWLGARHRLTPGSPLYREDPLPLRGVVPLAGVVDLARGFELRLSDGSVEAFLGGSPERVPEHYRAASPAALQPLGLPQVLVHGTEDDTVPVSMSEAYCQRGRELGDPVRCVTLPGAGHFEVIDPRSREWSHVMEAVRSVLNPISVGGHRGSGCTDSEHALKRERSRKMPLENTLASFKQAFDDGADFVELDVVRTEDNKLVVIHSNKLADHVRPPFPRSFVGELTYEALSKLHSGVEESGRRGEIPTLASVLDLAKEQHARRGGAGVVLNIEIKDVKGTDAPRRQGPSLVELLAEQVRCHELPLDAVVFSSFAVSDLVELAARLPGARLGMLFDEDRTPGNTAGQRVYSGMEDRYLLFTPENVRFAVERIGAAGARLEFAHPELGTLNDAAMAEAARQGLRGLFCWAMNELAPELEKVRAAVELARRHGLGLGFITDFVPELRRLAPGST